MDKRTQDAILAKTMQYAVDTILEAEKQLDEAIEHYDQMSTDEIAELRNKRRQELEKSNKKKAELLKLGHGHYTEVFEQQEWFEICKQSERVITHFYRPSNLHCATLDQHLHKLATQHLETRFIKINAEKAQYLSDKLQVRVLPSLVMTKSNTVVDVLEGFTELGDTDKFTTDELEKRIAFKNAIDYNEEQIRARQIQAEQQRREASQNQAIRQSEMHTARQTLIQSIDDDDDWLNDE